MKKTSAIGSAVKKKPHSNLQFFILSVKKNPVCLTLADFSFGIW
jgi:hypothetical protein